MAISLTLFYGSPNAHNGAAASLGSIARASQKLNAIALSQFRVSLTAVLFITSLAPCGAAPAPVIHYAPTENLEHIDVALIDGAWHEIDMAAYVLTDWPVGRPARPCRSRCSANSPCWKRLSWPSNNSNGGTGFIASRRSFNAVRRACGVRVLTWVRSRWSLCKTASWDGSGRSFRY
jgi:hypothetical protein